MIIVTGTKRSGTSLTMQAFSAGGFHVIGDAFPEAFRASLRSANEAGFYESRFRVGINFTTNPDPVTGEYVHPSDHADSVVKIFAEGLTRTDLAFIDHVVATMRPVREYAQSVERLRALDAAGAKSAPPGGPIAYPPAGLEWWSETFALLFDAIQRRYPMMWVAHDALLRHPTAVFDEVFRFVGRGDVASAARVVRPDASGIARGDLPPPAGLDDPAIAIADRLYATVLARQPIDLDLIDALNETNERLVPALEAAAAALHASLEARARTEPSAVRTSS